MHKVCFLEGCGELNVSRALLQQTGLDGNMSAKRAVMASYF